MAASGGRKSCGFPRWAGPPKTQFRLIFDGFRRSAKIKNFKNISAGPGKNKKFKKPKTDFKMAFLVKLDQKT